MPFNLVANLIIRRVRKTNAARLGDAFEARGYIDAVAHQIAVALLDDIAEMNADPKLDAALGRQAGVALDKAVLHLNRAAHRVDHATELDEAAVAGALDHAPMMHRDGRINQIAAQRPEPRQNAILVRAREPAIADDIRDQDRSDLPGLADGAPSGPVQRSTKTGRSRGFVCGLRAIEPKEFSSRPMTEGWLRAGNQARGWAER